MKKEVESNLNEKVKNIQGTMQEALKKLMPQMEKISKELNNISSPKSKKDSKIKGKNVFLSLTIDNRVIINFPCQDDAQAFYDSWKEIKVEEKKSWFKKIFRWL